MTLQFKRQDSYGRVRLYPANKAAEAIVRLTGRVCLNPDELDMLREAGGFVVRVVDAAGKAGAP